MKWHKKSTSPAPNLRKTIVDPDDFYSQIDTLAQRLEWLSKEIERVLSVDDEKGT